MPMNKILTGDCLRHLRDLPASSVDLAFADPPFNVGYEYDVYDDRRSSEDYLEWTESWLAAVKRTLKPDGSFWIAIGDDSSLEGSTNIDAVEYSSRSRSWATTPR